MLPAPSHSLVSHFPASAVPNKKNVEKEFPLGLLSLSASAKEFHPAEGYYLWLSET
jgi:hypothetical protein